jgi:DNA topoisomerase-1
VRFGSDDEPGIRRRGRTRVTYVDERSGRHPSAETLGRIRSLAVPPAWTDVWISPDPDSHVQATGRDARGRKQYRYHPGFVAERTSVKFAELPAFGQCLPHLRRQVAADLRRPEPDLDHVVAIVVRLLDVTSLRVGNDEYAKANGSRGLTTLQNRHVQVARGTVRLSFRGKSAHHFDVSVDDPVLARLVRRCQDLPGQRLFEYVDEAGAVHAVGSASVNEYLRRNMDMPATAKLFRTWNASVAAGEELVSAARLGPPTAATLNSAIDAVAAELGNTRAVCRKSYVHPELVEAFLDGSLTERWSSPLQRRVRDLSAPESRLLRFLTPRAPRRRGPPRASTSRGSRTGRDRSGGSART